jgi:CDP-diacylglycerol--glycerol-3-phosphate 3-phosphatidyltransferase
MIIVMVANFAFPFWNILGIVLMWIALALTVISLVVYIYDNRAVLKEQK